MGDSTVATVAEPRSGALTSDNTATVATGPTVAQPSRPTPNRRDRRATVATREPPDQHQHPRRDGRDGRDGSITHLEAHPTHVTLRSQGGGR